MPSNRRKFALWDRIGRFIDSDWSNITPWYKRYMSAILMLLSWAFVIQSKYVPKSPKTITNKFLQHFKFVNNLHCGIEQGDLSIQTGAILHHDINGTSASYLCRLVEPSRYSPNMYQSPWNLSPVNFLNANRRKFALWDRIGLSIDSDWSNIAPWYKRHVSAILMSLGRDFVMQSKCIPKSPKTITNKFLQHFKFVEKSQCGIAQGDLSIQTGAILHHD